MHNGLGRTFIGIRWGRVLRVRRGERHGANMGVAPQWVVDLEDSESDRVVEGATVISSRIPRVHTQDRPSFAIWGPFSGSIQSTSMASGMGSPWAWRRAIQATRASPDSQTSVRQPKARAMSTSALRSAGTSSTTSSSSVPRTPWSTA